MPLGSIEAWRACIGSSWCALGRPMKAKLYKHPIRLRCQQSTGPVLSDEHHLSAHIFAMLIPWITVSLLGSCLFQLRVDEFIPIAFFFSLFENTNQETYLQHITLFISHICMFFFNICEDVNELWKTAIECLFNLNSFSWKIVQTCLCVHWNLWSSTEVSDSDFMTTLAAAVVDSLLSRSGDVESNPGPGLNYDSVDASQILSEDELPDVMDEILSLKSSFYSLGLGLRLRISDLDTIKEQSSGDDKQALTRVLKLWFNRKYNVKKFGEPTWRILVEAIDRESGGNDHKLAKKIASNHSADQILLNIGNTREILDLTWDYRSKWKLLGIKLGIDAGTLDAIYMDNKSVDGSLVELINRWLRGDKRWPNPTRSIVTSALESLGMPSLTEGSQASELVSSRSDDNGKQSETILSYGGYLKSLYTSQSLSSSSSHEHQWPPPATNRVFRLAMITAKQLVRRGSSLEDEVHLRKAVAGKVEQILQQRVPIELKDIFHSRRDKRKKVLVEGAPGCGKSTLSLNICHQWTDHQLFNEYDLVILVRLRESVVQSAKCIADILPRCDESMGKEVERLMKHGNGKGTLFIFDGWDELSPNVSGHSVVLSLLEGTMLHECSIIITSRPTSSANLHNVITSRVEILGFTRSELKQYFISCLESDTLAETLLQSIQQNPSVLGSCYVLVNAP